jgi:hypothetical protein
MKWEKKGLIFCPDGKSPWNISHAQVPVLDKLNEDVARIYYATRDSSNKSSISFIEVDSHDPQKIRYIHNEPILQAGNIGAFDDCGVMPSWIVNHDNKKYLYYIGWNVHKTIPYHNAIGLAISDDGIHFKRYSQGPIIDRTYSEPLFSGTSCVLKENEIWKMWYLSCTEWRVINNIPEARYHIKYAESKNGIDWERNGTVAIEYKNEAEAAIANASVIKENSGYKMWFCYRNFGEYRKNKQDSYKIGYGESQDGKKWIRKDELAGIETSEAGWDSEMIAYPHVTDINGQRMMFYNGNGFGKTGIGYAILNN